MLKLKIKYALMLVIYLFESTQHLNFISFLFQENHVSGDQVEPNIIPKRRRWGTPINTDITPTFSISTDFLKVQNIFTWFSSI